MQYEEVIRREIAQILTETEREIPEIPADLEQNYGRVGGWAGLTAGAGLGAKVGAGIGIAAGPLGAIAGTIPGFVIGGVIGYLGFSKAGEQFSAEK
jgi:hypothetical protein